MSLWIPKGIESRHRLTLRTKAFGPSSRACTFPSERWMFPRGSVSTTDDVAGKIAPRTDYLCFQSTWPSLILNAPMDPSPSIGTNISPSCTRTLSVSTTLDILGRTGSALTHLGVHGLRLPWVREYSIERAVDLLGNRTQHLQVTNIAFNSNGSRLSCEIPGSCRPEGLQLIVRVHRHSWPHLGWAGWASVGWC